MLITLGQRNSQAVAQAAIAGANLEHMDPLLAK
eukprot:CAMPEP_0183364134 /NCGR_PEP_ID=MMETSP0164_2-20130417/78580_1 /TAXON_ID=221442 /ORGANISM="Coccolithus pelagicus ssp braarudi, Strain PLY182g" /LENGTH=32 /DNA_ID= /DNA_START= /DNA_END= /DNA_ORIENTATION=